MGETAIATLGELRALAARIITHKENALTDVRSVNYFTYGDYANDSFMVVTLVQQLDAQLIAGDQIPASWQYPTVNGIPTARMGNGATLKPRVTHEQLDPSKNEIDVNSL